MENSNGPKFDPCGIPHWTVFCFDLVLLCTQTCFLLLKYSFISLWAVPFTPYFSIFFRRIERSICKLEGKKLTNK